MSRDLYLASAGLPCAAHSKSAVPLSCLCTCTVRVLTRIQSPRHLCRQLFLGRGRATWLCLLVQANDNQFKQELAKVVGTELWDAAKAASADVLKVLTSSETQYTTNC